MEDTEDSCWTGITAVKDPPIRGNSLYLILKYPRSARKNGQKYRLNLCSSNYCLTLPVRSTQSRHFLKRALQIRTERVFICVACGCCPPEECILDGKHHTGKMIIRKNVTRYHTYLV